MTSNHGRCCAFGQTVKEGSCVGRVVSCPSGFHPSTTLTPGCVLDSRRVAISARTYRFGPEDWSSSHLALETRRVDAFWMDRGEVTLEAFASCVQARGCSSPKTAPNREPGQPVTGVTVEQASGYCRWVQGYLPRREQWLAASVGERGSRFPWGQTGLVCRRAVYGTVRGPCAQGIDQPEMAGTRSDGASPDGLLDLVGNVGELVRGDQSPEVRGGSYRSELASQLRTWSVVPYEGPRPDVGFRCAYDRSSPEATPGEGRP
jgi:formylglycine-generating enzyme